MIDIGKRLTKATSTLAVILSLMVAGPSSAIINYGDYSDIPPGTVSYLGVTESSSTDAVPPPLYGAPTINGDLLDFDPLAFGSNAAGAGGSDITDGQLNFTVEAAQGESISVLEVSEAGDYSFNGVTPDIGTFVSVGVTTRVTILEVDNAVLAVPIVLQQLDNFSIDYQSAGQLPNTNTSGLQFWSLGYTIDFSGVSGNVTKAEVAINNQLTAISTEGNLAFIAKKDFNIKVPEPGSLALIGVGGLLVMSRRKNR